MADAVLQPAEGIGARIAVKRDIAAIVGTFAVLSAVYWVGVFMLSGEAGFPLDDAFIHLQFARNLYEDGQMAFNRGVPSSGSTAPLYPVLLAAVYCAVRNWYAASFIIGGLCSLGTALAVYGILRSWTGRLDLARWGGLLTVVACPTLLQAYSGMESPVYSLLFLVGLWLYASPRRRVLASLVFALCIWLRPEFLVLLPLICLERLISIRRGGHRGLAAFLAEVWPHVVIWVAMTLVYAAYHWHQDQHLVPSTFEAKAVAPGVARPAWLDGLPAAVKRGNVFHIFLSILVWPTLVLVCAGIGLGANCAPLAFGLREAIVAMWRNKGPTASASRLALIVLIGYPWLRGFVDSGGFILFQFQRYYAHMTPLLILTVIGAVPATNAVVQRRFWDWRGMPLILQQRRTFQWAALCLVIMGTLGVMSVWNINSMQVRIGHWLRDNTTEDQLVAVNDIGAIGFVSRRPILDTVGLVEPEIVKHYMNGGTLLEYLKKRDPAYVIIFPNWYEKTCARNDMLETVKEIELDCNVVCGGSKMVIYRPRWNDARDE
ncbi:MAG: hypothetical protein JXQ75_10105 [Phycisphaerae bacterium]|nr:hypothetical protein [Phycisphaerae bacterium]